MPGVPGAAHGQRLAGYLARAATVPVVLLLLAIAGLAVGHQLEVFANRRGQLDRWWVALALALGTLLAQRALSAFLTWVERERASLGGHAIPLVRRAVNVALIVIGLLLVLDQLGISITPLLTGLGITGIAVALALQPLLTNLFAGSYVLSDSAIRIGDHIALSGGPTGRIEAIGWRATRLRDADGNLVVLPNAALAAAIVTNYGPAGMTLVTANVLLPRDADLDSVERVAREELHALVGAHADLVSGAEPQARFSTLNDDSRVQLVLTLHARAQADVPALTHALLTRAATRIQPRLPRGSEVADDETGV